MAELTPVPAPRSPFDGWRGRVVSVVVVGILVAIAKPWGGSAAPERPDPTADAVATPAPIERTPVGRAVDASAFGAEPPPAAWAILTATRTIPIDFLERTDADPSAGPAHGGDPTPGPIVSGPVVELGTSDEVDAVAITHPADRSVATIRAWQFRDGATPRRLELGRLDAPWPVDHVEFVGHRLSEMAADQVLPWEPGLYRLDLLIEPADRVRSVMVHVSPGRDRVVATTDDDESMRSRPAFDPEVLELLPDAANLWAVGGYLSGWRREASRRDCRVAEIWRATDPADACWPLPLGRTDAIGVNLTDGRAVATIALRGIDPLPGPTDATAQLDIAGRSGLALVRETVGALPDGIYGLDVRTTGDEALTWYVEVGPIGRAVAAYYEASTSR